MSSAREFCTCDEPGHTMTGACMDSGGNFGHNHAPTEGARDAKDALHWIMRFAQDIKEPCGEDHESPAAIRNAKLAVIAQVAAQGLGIVGGPSLAERDAGAGTAVALVVNVHGEGKRVRMTSELPAGTPLYAHPDPLLAEAVEALEMAYDAMNHLGDVLNGMDAVEEEDEQKTEPAFEKVRAVLAKVQAAKEGAS